MLASWMVSLEVKFIGNRNSRRDSCPAPSAKAPVAEVLYVLVGEEAVM